MGGGGIPIVDDIKDFFSPKEEVKPKEAPEPREESTLDKETQIK